MHRCRVLLVVIDTLFRHSLKNTNKIYTILAKLSAVVVVPQSDLYIFLLLFVMISDCSLRFIIFLSVASSAKPYDKRNVLDSYPLNDDESTGYFFCFLFINVYVCSKQWTLFVSTLIARSNASISNLDIVHWLHVRLFLPLFFSLPYVFFLMMIFTCSIFYSLKACFSWNFSIFEQKLFSFVHISLYLDISQIHRCKWEKW